MTTSEVFRKLILACVDHERTLRHESKFVDARRAATLIRLAHERGQFVADLERLGKCPQPHDGSWAELAREAWRGICVTAAGRNARDAISSCRSSRARAEAVYDKTLQASWPLEISSALAAQRRCLQDEAAELNKLALHSAT
jgi:hypothetical protein